MTCKKIHSIILSVTCHGLRNFAPAHTHPHELLKLYELLFFEFEFWPTPPHPYMTHPTPPLYDTPHPNPPLHDPSHPTPSWPTPPLHDPPHPTLPHPTPSWPTPPHPTPGTFLGTKEPFFMGCFTVSLSVDNKRLTTENLKILTLYHSQACESMLTPTIQKHVWACCSLTVRACLSMSQIVA